jgi:hypothetical protein
MKMFFKAVVIAGLLGLGSTLTALQSPQTPAGSAGSSAVMENGSLLYAELSKTVDAKKAKTGDPVVALLLADVVSHGKIVVHRDSKLRGHVTEVQPRSKENQESRLGIVFDRVILKGGQEVPFHSTLLAIRPAPRLTLDEPPSAPVHPGFNLPSGPLPPKQNPAPNDPNPMDPSINGEPKSREGGMAGIGPTNIDGLSLSSGGNGQAIVSLTHTVKLESGVRFELRVTGAAP